MPSRGLLREDVQALRPQHQQERPLSAAARTTARASSGEKACAFAYLDRQEGRLADELGDEAVRRPLVDAHAAHRAA